MERELEEETLNFYKKKSDKILNNFPWVYRFNIFFRIGMLQCYFNTHYMIHVESKKIRYVIYRENLINQIASI